MWREAEAYSHYMGWDEPEPPDADDDDGEPNPSEKGEDDGQEYGHPGDTTRRGWSNDLPQAQFAGVTPRHRALMSRGAPGDTVWSRAVEHRDKNKTGRG
jgi:hypothetical protein